MSTLDECSQLVSSIYDAGLDFEKWPAVIERLSDALGGNGGGAVDACSSAPASTTLSPRSRSR